MRAKLLLILGMLFATTFLVMGAGTASASVRGDGTNPYTEEPTVDCDVDSGTVTRTNADSGTTECVDILNEAVKSGSGAVGDSNGAVLGSNSSRSLAFTGGDVVGLVVIGGALVAVGGGLAAYRRRHAA